MRFIAILATCLVAFPTLGKTMATINSVETGADNGAMGFIEVSKDGQMNPNIFSNPNGEFAITSIRVIPEERGNPIYIESSRLGGYDSSSPTLYVYNVYYNGELAIKNVVTGGAAFTYRDYGNNTRPPEKGTQALKDALRSGGSVKVEIETHPLIVPSK